MDRDGYAIYEKIAQQALSVLTPDGKIFTCEVIIRRSKVKELFQEVFHQTRRSWKTNLDGSSRQWITQKELARRAVILPTETVYGITKFLNQEAVDYIYELKT